MSDDLKPTSWAGRLLRGSAYLLVAAILLHLTIALIREIWWVFLIVAIVTIVVAGLKWWRKLRNPWN